VRRHDKDKPCHHDRRIAWLRHVVRVILLLHAIVVVRLGLMSRGSRLPYMMIITTIITDMCVREIL